MARSFFIFSNGRRLAVESVSYVELNPVKAGMVDFAWDYPWSSVHEHLSGNDAFGLVSTEKMLNLTGDWKRYLLDAQNHATENFAKHERTGRPLGDENFIEMAEFLLKRDLKKQKPGAKVLGGNN